jgi:hypothetical protein
MVLKLLETEFIKDAWFGNRHYQTRPLSHGRSQTLQALAQDFWFSNKLSSGHNEINVTER